MKTSCLLIAALGCTACTSLQVNEFDPSKPSSRVGIPYPLGFTQYRVELTRRVVACGNIMEVAASAKIEETRNAPDPLRRYVIDPNSLGSIIKTSDVKLEYHPNGLVSALNASAVDKTGEVIANLGGIAVKLASLAAAPGGPGEACEQKVVDALAEIAKQKPIVETANDELERSLTGLKVVREKVVQMGTAVDDDTKKALSNAYDGLIKATARQKAETVKLETLLAKVSHKQVVHWPQNGDTGRGVFRMDSEVLDGWARNLSTDPLVAGEQEKLDIFIHLAAIAGGARILPLAYPTDDARAAPAKGVPEEIDAALGIPFRQPDYGEVRICNINFCDLGGELLAEQRGNALQLGEIYYLPCRSRPFTSVECKFELTQEGWLKSMGTSSKEAALAGATAAVKGLLDNAASIQSTLAGADTAALEANTKGLKAQAEYEAAVAALLPKANASTAAETASLTASIELARARKNLIEAEAELSRVQNPGQAGGQ